MDQAFRLLPGTKNLASEKFINWIRAFIVAVTIINLSYLYYELGAPFGQYKYIFNLSALTLVIFGIFFWFAVTYFLRFTAANELITTDIMGITRQIEVPQNPATSIEKLLANHIKNQKGYASFIAWNKISGITEGQTHITLSSNEYNRKTEGRVTIRLSRQLQNFEQLQLTIKKQTGLEFKKKE